MGSDEKRKSYWVSFLGVLVTNEPLPHTGAAPAFLMTWIHLARTLSIFPIPPVPVNRQLKSSFLLRLPHPLSPPQQLNHRLPVTLDPAPANIDRKIRVRNQTKKMNPLLLVPKSPRAPVFLGVPVLLKKGKKRVKLSNTTTEITNYCN